MNEGLTPEAAPGWLQPPPGVVDVPLPGDALTARQKGSKPRATKAEVFAEKSERTKQAAEERVKPGTCPRCGAAVMYAREQGLLTVVDALPSKDSWGETYIVVNNKFKRVTLDVVRFYKPKLVHAVHDQCGRAVPVPVKIERVKVENPWEDIPPFERASESTPPLKRWRCWNCDEIIEPEQQGIVIQYDGADMSYYICHCDYDCPEKVRNTAAPTKRKVYPRIDKFGRYAELKKGESLPEAGDAK